MKSTVNIDEVLSKVTVKIDDAISKAAKAAIKEYDKEKKEEARKNVFHNTRLLLKHYNELRIHVDNAIDNINQLESELMDIGELHRDELYILSIKKSKSKTLIMIAHIDMALELLRNKQIKMGTTEKFEALTMFYIEEVPYEEIVKHFNCGVNTPRRWINDMIKELSILLFGIEGLKLDAV